MTGKRRHVTVAAICTLLLALTVSAAAQAAGFKEKSISASSVNQTDDYKAEKVKGKKSGKGFVGAMSAVSVRLLQECLDLSDDHTNVLISPDSILTAVTMAGNGAGGSTLREMKDALGGITPKQYSQYLYTLHKRVARSSLVKYKSANSIWYKKGKIKLKKPFLQMLVSYYKAQVYAAPFNSKTVTDINRWVYNHTNGKIGNIIQQLPPAARMVLVNAIYFNGKWEDPYSGTVKRTFTDASGAAKKVPMFESVEHNYVTANGADGFVRYYAGGTTAFMALLPPEGMSVKQFVQGLDGDTLIGAYKKRTSSNVLVYTRMPKFSYDYSVSLNKPLKNLGIQKAFQSGANFTKMSKQPLQIDEAIHKTHISVTKNGTEAAAATAILMKATAVMMPEEKTVKYVYLDRPFVYAIIDTKTGLPLFLGTVMKVK